MFTNHVGASFAILLVYVNDIVLFGNDIFEISHITKLLDTIFTLRILGILNSSLDLKLLVANMVSTFVKENTLWIFSMMLAW